MTDMTNTTAESDIIDMLRFMAQRTLPMSNRAVLSDAADLIERLQGLIDEYVDASDFYDRSDETLAYDRFYAARDELFAQARQSRI